MAPGYYRNLHGASYQFHKLITRIFWITHAGAKQPPGASGSARAVWAVWTTILLEPYADSLLI